MTGAGDEGVQEFALPGSWRSECCHMAGSANYLAVQEKAAMEEGDPWRHWYSTNCSGSPERGVGLPRIQSGGGRAVLDTGYNADMTYLVSRLWRIKDTKD